MDPKPPAHFHAYRWQGERRTYDQEADRRPATRAGEPPSPGFLANPCTPVQVNHWLLRPAKAIAHTLDTPAAAAAWYRAELEAAAGSFASPQLAAPDRLSAHVEHVARTLRHGGDVSGGWYLRGTGYLTLDLIGCSPNRAAPDLPCPLHS